MPNWDGIEDVSPRPYRVWFSRVKETDDWKPLRKVDCWALNESKDDRSTTVIIEGGRATADKTTRTITSNFHRTPDRMLASAIWFIRKEPNPKAEKEQNLDPILNEEDSHHIESLYQSAIEATSSFGKGIDAVIKDAVELEDKSRVLVVKSNGGNTLSMRKYPPGWLSGSLDLQRGYGGYTVEGEDNENMLGPLKHLFFVVHGVGEAIWSREDSSMGSLRDEVDRIRVSMQQRQVEGWRKQCEKNKKEGYPVPPMPDRIEFIPIEWYDQIHSSSSALSRSLKAATLPTIPALRGIANEAVFDVLIYLTPAFCGRVLDNVTSQITTLYEKFLKIHPTFLDNGGTCSLIGHSLGSVICWDLLSVMKDAKEPPTPTQQQQTFGDGVGQRQFSGSGGVAFTSNDSATVDVGYQAYAEQENADVAQNGTWGPTLPRRLPKTLPFEPEHAIFLGSPIAMFLTLRGAHPVFDQFRLDKKKEILELWEAHEKKEGWTEINKYNDSADNGDDKKAKDADDHRQLPELPYASPFTLPVNGGIYNVFHPSDPVAYRIEPLLLPPDTSHDEFPEPVHVTAQGEGVRLHVKAQQLGGEIAKVWEGKRRFTSLLTKAVSALAAEDTARSSSSPRSLDGYPTGPQVFPLGGKSDRVDFQLQRGVVENEYVSAIMAHSSYFVNTDVQDFVMGLAQMSSQAKQQQQQEESVTTSTNEEDKPDTI